MANTAPTLGWICTDPCLWATAEAMLDDKYENALEGSGYTDMYYIGRLGPLNVVIVCLPQPPHAADVANIARNMAANFNSIKALLVTGFGAGVRSAGIKLGDLVINQVSVGDDSKAEPTSTSASNVVQRAVCVLQREVGADGRFLSSNVHSAVSNFPRLLEFSQRPSDGLPNYPKLHYGNIGSVSPDMQNEESPDRRAAVKNIVCFDKVTAGLTNLPIATIPILGVSNFVNSPENDVWKKYAAANAASYAKEIVQVMTNYLMNDILALKGTEKIVPPYMDPQLPPFPPHQRPNHGNAVLLVIPTENKSKTKLLQEFFSEQVPNGVVVHTVPVPVDSGVGQQPYNEAGIIGAHNRISNALLSLDDVKCVENCRVGTVIVASIESYIQTDNIDRPTDYGVVVIHNATTQKTTACLSEGVTVPPAYVDRARRFGFEGDPNRGRVTVGQILAANVPGLDKADWQAVLAGRSRYDLLKDAIMNMRIPW